MGNLKVFDTIEQFENSSVSNNQVSYIKEDESIRYSGGISHSVHAPITAVKINGESITTDADGNIDIGNVQETLVSGSNIKTINHQSILGDGDIEIGGSNDVTIDSELSTSSINAVENRIITEALNNKQDIISDLDSIRQNAQKGSTALQSYTEKYTGTITGVSANGTSIATSGVANIPAASTNAYGVTKLSTATNSTSTTLAATASAVKSAYDLASSKQDVISDLATIRSNANLGATAIQSVKTINGSSIVGSGDVTTLPAYAEYTGTSATAAVTTMYGYFPTTLVEGTRVAVKFEGSLTYITTLNVNGTGAKNVYYKGSALTSGMINRYNTYEFVFDGSYWRIIGVDTDTHHTAKNIVGASATATANASATNGNVYLNLVENSTVRSKHNIKGEGTVTVTSDSSGNIIISGAAAEGSNSEANVQAVDTSETLDDVSGVTYVKYVAQTLTDAQKAQARANIGAEDALKLSINGRHITPENGIVDLNVVETTILSTDDGEFYGVVIPGIIIDENTGVQYALPNTLGNIFPPSVAEDELVAKSYVDGLVGDINSILESIIND